MGIQPEDFQNFGKVKKTVRKTALLQRKRKKRHSTLHLELDLRVPVKLPPTINKARVNMERTILLVSKLLYSNSAPEKKEGIVQ